MIDNVTETVVQIIKTAANTHSHKSPLVHLVWLLDGVELHRRTDGDMGHSLEDAKKYILASLINGYEQGGLVEDIRSWRTENRMLD